MVPQLSGGTVTRLPVHAKLTICKTNTPQRKDLLLASIKKMSRKYCLQLSQICFNSTHTIKYKRIVHIPIMTQFPISLKQENGLQQVRFKVNMCELCNNLLSWHQITTLQNLPNLRYVTQNWTTNQTLYETMSIIFHLNSVKTTIVYCQ